MMVRDDLSSRLVHLTRGDTDHEAAVRFMSIVNGRSLRGSNGCIKGQYRCVCFSEAPVSKLSQILANPMAHGMRYKPFGLMVEKSWLFAQGGRPVIYQPDAEYELLHEQQRYRHVRYEPGAVDFTWEREWRILTDSLSIDPDTVTLVVPNRSWERWILGEHIAMLKRRAMALDGIIGPSSVTDFPWHFLVLEDLGLDIPSVSAPPEAREQPGTWVTG